MRPFYDTDPTVRGLVLLRTDANGLVTYCFESLAVQGLSHAVFTRLGGVSRGPFATLNVGHNVGDDETAVAENHARIYAYLGLTADRVVSPHQVHGNRVAVVMDSDAGRVIPSADGLITAAPGVALLLRFADCQSILLYDPVHQAIGLIHAGWRGVAQGIARRAVEAMREAFDTHPQDLIAALGPAIGPCCYSVGHNVAAAMGYALSDWDRVMALHGENEWRFDLSAANHQQLTDEGVEKIEHAELCTACHQDEFYSHRGDNGRTGRFAVVICLEPRAAVPESRTAVIFETEPEPSQEAPFASLHPPGFPAFGEAAGDEP